MRIADLTRELESGIITGEMKEEILNDVIVT
jgi:hypothetical protein